MKLIFQSLGTIAVVGGVGTAGYKINSHIQTVAKAEKQAIYKKKNEDTSKAKSDWNRLKIKLQKDDETISEKEEEKIELEAEIKKLNEKTTTIEKEIAALKTKISGIETQITAKKQALATADSTEQNAKTAFEKVTKDLLKQKALLVIAKQTVIDKQTLLEAAKKNKDKETKKKDEAEKTKTQTSNALDALNTTLSAQKTTEKASQTAFDLEEAKDVKPDCPEITEEANIAPNTDPNEPSEEGERDKQEESVEDQQQQQQQAEEQPADDSSPKKCPPSTEDIYQTKDKLDELKKVLLASKNQVAETKKLINAAEGAKSEALEAFSSSEKQEKEAASKLTEETTAKTAADKSVQTITAEISTKKGVETTNQKAFDEAKEKHKQANTLLKTEENNLQTEKTAKTNTEQDLANNKEEIRLAELKFAELIQEIKRLKKQKTFLLSSAQNKKERYHYLKQESESLKVKQTTK